MKNLSSKQVKKILLLVLFLVVIIGVLIYGNYRKRSTHSRVNNDQLFVIYQYCFFGDIFLVLFNWDT